MHCPIGIGSIATQVSVIVYHLSESGSIEDKPNDGLSRFRSVEFVGLGKYRPNDPVIPSYLYPGKVAIMVAGANWNMHKGYYWLSQITVGKVRFTDAEKNWRCKGILDENPIFENFWCSHSDLFFYFCQILMALSLLPELHSMWPFSPCALNSWSPRPPTEPLYTGLPRVRKK